MTLRKGLLVVLFGILVSLVVTPAAFADKDVEIKTVVGSEINEALGYKKDSATHSTFYLDGTLPPDVHTKLVQTIDGYHWFYLVGTPSMPGTWNFRIVWYAGDGPSKLETFNVSFTVYDKPQAQIHVEKESYDVGEVAKITCVAINGSDEFKYYWYYGTSKADMKAIGSDIDYLPYPTSGKLSASDDGLYFTCVVVDKVTGAKVTSNYVQIHVACSHSWSAWKEKSPATCTAEQILQRTCSKCGKSETKTGEVVKGHSWGTWVEDTPASCTTSQILKRTCSACGKTETKTGEAAKGHTWGPWTAISDDIMVHTCTVCTIPETAAIVAGYPFVKTQPVGGNLLPGAKHTMTVEAEASGLGDLTYQWMVTKAPGDKVEAVPGATGTTFETTIEGYYFVRVTQTAGNAANSVDSDLAYVHVHELGEWVADETGGTVSRECTDEGCGYTESYTFDEFRALYPAEAKKLGITPFAQFYKANAALFWVLVGVVVLVIAAAAVLVVLLVKRGKDDKGTGSSGGKHAGAHAAPAKRPDDEDPWK